MRRMTVSCHLMVVMVMMMMVKVKVKVMAEQVTMYLTYVDTSEVRPW